MLEGHFKSDAIPDTGHPDRDAGSIQIRAEDPLRGRPVPNAFAALATLSGAQAASEIAVATTRLCPSPAMQRIAGVLPRIARQAPTVMITGESGVGKEVLARDIHRLDARRRKGPFVAVNCGGLTESLLESELFGHERGAFTGALRTKEGVFERAHGGTLFLDEIGEMPAAMQVKLLRTIQDRAITRVGGESSVAVDLRLICATHRDLRQLVQDGAFREDLYYRIHVISLHVPPLRERPEDILWFARRVLAEYAAKYPDDAKTLSVSAESQLLCHDWPGNLRELRHCIERACILTEGPCIESLACLEVNEVPYVRALRHEGETLAGYVSGRERERILEMLIANGWHIGQTAASLRISRKNLWEKMKKLDIQKQKAQLIGRESSVPRPVRQRRNATVAEPPCN